MDDQNELHRRIAALEESVRSIQQQLAQAANAGADELLSRIDSIEDPEVGTPRRGTLDVTPPPIDYRIRKDPKKIGTAKTSIRFKTPSASFWMAWGAGIAFVLAAVYFIKLVYDFGWLTPERQIGLAIMAGVGLIFGGLALSRHDKNYSAYLPAAGIVILYLAIYSAHIFYQLVGTGLVIFAVGATTIGSMWLNRHFNNTAYAIFAVIGAYAFPLVIRSESTNVVDMVIYFAAWSLLFSFISLQEKKRIVYMLAMFFAIIGFDIAWRLSASDASWVPAALYQFAQFIVFSATAAYYSVSTESPMDRTDAAWHGIALFYFYVVEYLILKQNVPDLAPFIALASVVVLLVAFFAGTRFIKDGSNVDASATLVSLYCAAVTAHVFFFEIVPTAYLPWAALLAPVAAFLMRPRFDDRPDAFIPIAAVALFVSVVGLNILLSEGGRATDVFLPNIALFVYAAFLYAASRLVRKDGRREAAAVPLLYAGHVAFMVATVKTFDSGLVISIVWGVFAVVLLILALRLGNRTLGQSSLLIFAASGLKVLLYDLTGTPSLIRVLTLIVVGATLYAGGWMYQKIGPDAGERE